MADATFADPDLTTFCRLEELGLQAVGEVLGTWPGDHHLSGRRYR